MPLRTPIFWFGILLAGTILRLVGLNAESLWLDEGFTLHCATAPDLWQALEKEGNPPFFFLCMRGWIELFGLHPVALRTMPALASVLALWLFAAGLRSARMPGTAATLTLALYAGSPFICWYAHELRPYSFLEFGTVAMFCGWQFALRGRVAIGCLVAAGGASLACNSHYFGVPAAAAAFLVAWLEPPRARSRWLVALVILGAALTAIPGYVHYLPIQLDHRWGPQSHLGLGYLASLPLRLFVAHGGALPRLLLGVVAAMVGALVLVTIKNLWQRHAAEWGRTAAIGILAPFAVVLAVNILIEPRFTARYFIMATPYLAMFCGLAAARWPARRTNISVVVILLIFGSATAASLQLQVNDGYREACASVREHWQEGDRVGTVTGMPIGYCSGPLHAYLTPAMLANGFDSTHEMYSESPPSQTGRLHLVVRSMIPIDKFLRENVETLPITHRSPVVNRVQHLLVEWP